MRVDVVRENLWGGQANLLPESSFVDFSLYKLQGGKLLWKSTDFDEDLVDSVNYCMQVHPDEKIQLDQSQSLTVKGERYGGAGLGSNGGGVRCGNVGNLQIKGCGRNSLAGGTTDFFHNYGGASLKECLLEAIWGEVLSHALPFKGVRSAAVIGTGSTVPRKFPSRFETINEPRALVIRQTVIRPAHFMRAVFFRGKFGAINNPFDAHRTFEALSVLGDGFQQIYGKSEPANTVCFTPTTGFKVFAKRLAQQTATARARRIMHSSLTPSNVAIDGRWLDFSSISCVSDYGKILLARGAPDFMAEDLSCKEIIREFSWYINKNVRDANVDVKEVIGLFNDEFKSSEINEFCALSGLPLARLNFVSTVCKKSFHDAFRAITRHGNEQPFLILHQDNDVQPVMPEKTGDFFNVRLMRELCLSKDHLDSENRIVDLLPSDTLRRNMITAYWNLISEAATLGCGANSNGDSLMRRINGIRLNQDHQCLYRTVLYPRLDDAISRNQDLQSLVDSLSRYAQFFMAATDPTGLSIDYLQECNALHGANKTLTRISSANVRSRLKSLVFDNVESQGTLFKGLVELCTTVT